MSATTAIYECGKSGCPGTPTPHARAVCPAPAPPPTPTARGLIDGMIAHLPGWDVITPDRDSHENYARIRHARTGCEVGAHVDTYRKRLGMSVCFPRHANGHLGSARSWGLARYDEDPRDSIGMSPFREPKSLAQGFRSRLEARAVELWTLAWPKHLADLVADDRADRLLSELLGPSGHRRSWSKDHVGHVNGDPWSVTLEVSDGWGVKIEIHRATAKQARAIMRVLRGEP